MKWDEVAKIAGAVGGVILGILKLFQARGNQRAQREALKEKIELLRLLPEDSPTRVPLQDYIDRSVKKLIEDELDKRLDPFGMALGLCLLASGVFVATFALRSGGSDSWWFLAVPLIVIGVGGFVQDATPHKRDERGRIIRD